MTLDTIAIDLENHLSMEETKDLLKFISKEIACNVDAYCYSGASRDVKIKYGPKSNEESKIGSKRSQGIEGKIIKEGMSLDFKFFRENMLDCLKFTKLELNVKLSYGPYQHKELSLIDNIKQKVNQYMARYI